MKILVLQDDFPPHSLGGAGTVAHALAREYVRLGHEVAVLCAVQDRSLAGEVFDGGMRVVRFYSRYHERWRAWVSLYNPPAIRSLRTLLRDFTPDVVHAHNVHVHLSFQSLSLVKRSGASVILTAHDTMLYDYGKSPDGNRRSALALLMRYRLRYNPLRRLAVHRAMRGVRLVAVSNALSQALANNGFPGASVIYNGIDVPAWQDVPGATEAFKQAHGLANKKIVLFGGRISQEKGAACALAAMELVQRHVPTAILMVLGRRKLSGAKNIGWILGDELRAAYHASDVVIVPSVYLDPFPTVNLEAMACGKPVVATSFGGSQEAVLDGKTGFVVDPHNVDLLAGRLGLLLGDDARAKQMGEAGRRRALDNFSLVRQADEYLKLATR